MNTVPILVPTRWRKSSYSGDTGGECVEVAELWRKSSYSSDTGGECVEVAELPAAVAIRDSKKPAGPHLTVSPAAFRTFLRATARR